MKPASFVPKPLRHLVVVLGDQLDPMAALFDGFDPEQDCLWMAEVPDESRQVPSHRARTVLFLSAMRHFAQAQRNQGHSVVYHRLGSAPKDTLPAVLADDIAALQPEKVIAERAGAWRLHQDLSAVIAQASVPVDWRADRHFICDAPTFAHWATGRKTFVMETFYRFMRKRTGILMTEDGPVGGEWNYDRENRHPLKAQDLSLVPPPLSFEPDAITCAVMDDVARYLPDLPGEIAAFDWPVTPQQAQRALDDFITHRLPLFGRYQDAMWQNEPWLYHAKLSAALNLKLIHPRRVIDAALAAHQEGRAPLNAVEGFVRQILGWREYVRGIYMQFMPHYLEHNALGADHPLPPLYWHAKTDMNCLADVVGQVLRLGYGHHIQRLMVTGLFALLYGATPKAVHGWYLGLFVDAVDWVEVPNTMGMSQYADDGLMASKPYAASGKYIDRMSNYCKQCRFRPDVRLGEQACPFTVFYWDFLDRHQEKFRHHPRAALQWRSIERIDVEERAAIRAQAADYRLRVALGRL